MFDQISTFLAEIATSASLASQTVFGGNVGDPINIAFGLMTLMLCSLVVIALFVVPPFLATIGTVSLTRRLIRRFA